jgi:hypothetical protein
VPRHYAKLLRVTLTALLMQMAVAVAVAAVAGGNADAQIAYDKGDFATALRIYRPLADKN